MAQSMESVEFIVRRNSVDLMVRYVEKNIKELSISEELQINDPNFDGKNRIAETDKFFLENNIYMTGFSMLFAAFENFIRSLQEYKDWSENMSHGFHLSQFLKDYKKIPDENLINRIEIYKELRNAIFHNGAIINEHRSENTYPYKILNINKGVSTIYANKPSPYNNMDVACKIQYRGKKDHVDIPGFTTMYKEMYFKDKFYYCFDKAVKELLENYFEVIFD